MKRRKLFCAILTIALLVSMAPPIWAESADAPAEEPLDTVVMDVSYDIDDAEIEVLGDPVYTGSPIEPALNVYLDGEYLTEGTDFDAYYENNTNAGTARVILYGKGMYSGETTVEFTIAKRSVKGASVQSISAKTYNGTARKPTPAVKVNGKQLVRGTDYTLSYSNNTKAGPAKVTITGKGNYEGTTSTNFTIQKKSLSGAKATLSATSLTYNGALRKPGPTVKITLNGTTKKLKKGTDYTVKYTNNRKAGKAKVTITGKGNYKGTITKTFTIKKKSLSTAKVTGITYQKYTGKAKKPVPTVKIKLNGKTTKLKKGTDYTVTYKNNVKKGTATVFIKGKGDFKGTIKKTFKIYSPKTYYEKRYEGHWVSYAYYLKATKETFAVDDVEVGINSPNRRGHRFAWWNNGGRDTWHVSGSHIVFTDEGGNVKGGFLKNGKLYYMPDGGGYVIFKKTQSY